MSQWAFGVLLQALREQRGLSQRELAKLADIDHAYIYRLETGEKETPSDEALAKLVRGLKPAKREAEILKYLSQYRETDPALVKHVLADESVSFDLFASLAGAVHRGKVRPDYAKLVERMRRILSEDNDGG